MAAVFAARALEAADHADGHVGVAGDLAGEPHPGRRDPLRGEHVFLGLRHRGRLPGHELDAAGGAAGKAAAGMQLVAAALVDFLTDRFVVFFDRQQVPE